jgi:hypothetical protein
MYDSESKLTGAGRSDIFSSVFHYLFCIFNSLSLLALCVVVPQSPLFFFMFFGGKTETAFLSSRRCLVSENYIKPLGYQ